MKLTSLTRSNRIRRAVAFAAVVACGTTMLPAQAAPESQQQGQSSANVMAAQFPGEDDVPPPGSISLTQGIVTSSQGAVVNRSKMYITTGPENPIWGGMFFGLFNYPVESPTTFRPGCTFLEGPPCVPDPFHQPPCATDDPATQSGMQYQPHLMYALGPIAGGGADVGLVTKTKVNLVAFGSIPATATLTLRTPRANGEAQPFKVHIWQSTDAGRVNSCDPSFVPPTSALIEGQVDIYLSELTIDGVPVDVGASCRTERPSDLYLWGDFESGGYTAGTGGPVNAYDGMHPGSILPLTSPVYQGAFDGREIPASTGIDVAPFTGCVSGGDDLSSVLTSLASGPNNPVRVVQGPLVAATGTIPFENLTQCVPQIGQVPAICPLPGPAVPERPPLAGSETP